MANTYTAIATVTVGSGGAANIEFTSIPATYTDLVVKISARSAQAGNSNNCVVEFNGSGGTAYSVRFLYGDGSAAASASRSSQAKADIGFNSANSATANTFGNIELYIPNYAGSNNKSFSSDGVAETNAASVLSGLFAGLWSNTAAITSLKIFDFDSANLAQYSTATLYGIKNS